MALNPYSTERRASSTQGPGSAVFGEQVFSGGVHAAGECGKVEDNQSDLASFLIAV
jgi:hypothetical protein